METSYFNPWLKLNLSALEHSVSGGGIHHAPERMTASETAKKASLKAFKSGVRTIPSPKESARNFEVTRNQRMAAQSLNGKICGACQKDLCLSGFGINKAKPDGLNNRCKVCINAKAVSVYNNTPKRSKNTSWNQPTLTAKERTSKMLAYQKSAVGTYPPANLDASKKLRDATLRNRRAAI